MLRSRLILCFMVLTFWGCATQPVTSPPPVADSIPSTPDAPVERDVIGNAENPDSRPRRDTSSATASLLAAASQASEREDYSNAVAYLERAVRIEPRSARLWIALSAAHQAQGNLPVANQHVRKAIALAGNDDALQREAWLQLAEIRRAEGNTAEADAISRRYDTWQG